MANPRISTSGGHQGPGQEGSGSGGAVERQLSRHHPRTGQEDAASDPILKSWSLGAPLARTRSNKPTVPVGDGSRRTGLATALNSRPLPPTPNPLPLGQKDINTLNSTCPRLTRAGANDVERDTCKLLPRPSAGPPIDDLFAACFPAKNTSSSSPAATSSIATPTATATATSSTTVKPLPFSPAGGTRETGPSPPTPPPKSDRDRAAKGRRIKLNQNRQAGVWVVGAVQSEAETRRPPAEHSKGDTVREQRPKLHLSVPLRPDAAPSAPNTASVQGSHPAPPPDTLPVSPKPRSPMLGRLKNLARKHRRKGSSADVAIGPLTPDTASSLSPVLANEKSAMTAAMDRPAIEHGGRGQTDAPKGASNGIDRIIPILCKGTKVDVLIGTKTTAADVLEACSRLSEHRFDPRITILDEIFSPLGLKRHIRRYERIRDILNSWDSDSQNTLSVRIDALGSHANLELEHALRDEKAPHGFTYRLGHANRSGKWQRRYITLQRCGQVVSHKLPELDRSDKETVNICHLSDFDIYSPQEAQVSKRLKVPQKHCFAIKSQEKAIMFENNDNYVHYFCTDDGHLAQKFQAAVHDWRSWFWANKHLDLGRSDKTMDEPKVALVREASTVKRAPRVQHTGEAPQQPLLQLEAPDTFAPAGLLGNAYEERKKNMRHEPIEAPVPDDVPVAGTLLSRAGTINRSSSRRVTSRGSMSTVEDTAVSTRGRTTEPPINETQNAQGWFPSAAEHSRQIQERERQLRAQSGYPQPHQQHRGPPVNYPPPPHHRSGGGRVPIQPLISFATEPTTSRPPTAGHRGYPPPSRGGNEFRHQQQQQQGLGRRPTVSSAASSGQRSAASGRSRGGGYDREGSPPSPRASMAAAGVRRARSNTATSSEPPVPLISSIPSRMGSRRIVLPDRNLEDGTGRMVRIGPDTRRGR